MACIAWAEQFILCGSFMHHLFNLLFLRHRYSYAMITFMTEKQNKFIYLLSLYYKLYSYIV